MCVRRIPALPSGRQRIEGAYPALHVLLHEGVVINFGALSRRGRCNRGDNNEHPNQPCKPCIHRHTPSARDCNSMATGTIYRLILNRASDSFSAGQAPPVLSCPGRAGLLRPSARGAACGVSVRRRRDARSEAVCEDVEAGLAPRFLNEPRRADTAPAGPAIPTRKSPIPWSDAARRSANHVAGLQHHNLLISGVGHSLLHLHVLFSVRLNSAKQRRRRPRCLHSQRKRLNWERPWDLPAAGS